MSSKAKATPSKSLNKSGTTTKPTPKSGSTSPNLAGKRLINALTAKSGQTSTPTKDDTIHKLQKDLDVCRHQNAVLRAQFNPEKIREELQKEPPVNPDQNELFRTQIRELMEEILTLKSDTNQQDRTRIKALEDMNRILEKEKKELTQKIEYLKQERDHLSKNNSESANGELMKLKSKLKEIQRQEEESEVHNLRSRSKIQENINKILEKEKGDMTKKIEDLQQELDHLSKTSSRSANGEITKLKSELEAIQKQKDELESEVQSLRNSIEKLQNEKCNKESRIKELEGKCHDAFVDLERKGKEMKKLTDEHQVLIERKDKSSIEKLQDEKRKHESRIKELEGKCHDAFVDLERKGKEMKKLKDEHQGMIERKDKTIEELRKKSNMVDPMSPSSNIKEIEDERDELRKRLSEIISGKMTTNKPDIADLSDEFRPSKLGEMYSELYDNEWTDAFEEVESARGSEKAAIEYLLQILQEANSFIQKTATQYWEQAFKGILSFNGQVGEIKEDQLPGIVKKHLVDLLKKTSPYLKDIVGTVFVKQSKGQGEKEKLFRRHCAELCWMMRMQDPPVVLGSSTLSGNFNTSMYKEYTKRGSTVDFIVWPPLHLYENGPILSKGVAQGK